MMWHRRETRRQTEKTNGFLRSEGKVMEKRGEQSRAEGRGVGRWISEVPSDAIEGCESPVSAGNG